MEAPAGFLLTNNNYNVVLQCDGETLKMQKHDIRNKKKLTVELACKVCVLLSLCNLCFGAEMVMYNLVDTKENNKIIISAADLHCNWLQRVLPCSCCFQVRSKHLDSHLVSFGSYLITF